MMCYVVLKGAVGRITKTEMTNGTSLQQQPTEDSQHSRLPDEEIADSYTGNILAELLTVES